MLDYTPLEPDIQIIKKSPAEQRKLRDFSQALFENLQEANRMNHDFRRMQLLIDTLWNTNPEDRESMEKKIQSLYIKYKDFSDFSYEYVNFLLRHKGDYKTGLTLVKQILDKDEKMRWKIEDEVFMEISVQVVKWNFQEYVLYGLKTFWTDMQKFIERYRNLSNDARAIKNYDRALKYIQSDL